MAKKTITVPKTSYDAIKRVQVINDAIQAGSWERAILTYALWNDARPQHSSARSADAAVGKLVGTKDRAVRDWKKRVSDYFGKEDADKLTFGSKVPMPDAPWDAMGPDKTDEVTVDRVASKITGMKENSDDLVKVASAVSTNDVLMAAIKELLAADDTKSKNEKIDLYPSGMPVDLIEQKLSKVADSIDKLRFALEHSLESGMITEGQALVLGSPGTPEMPDGLRSIIQATENFMRRGRGEELLVTPDFDAEAWMKRAIGEDKLAMARTAEKAQDDSAWDEGLAALTEGSVTTAPEGAEDRMKDDIDLSFDEDEDDDV